MGKLAAQLTMPLRFISVAIAPDSAFGGHGYKWLFGDAEEGNWFCDDVL